MLYILLKQINFQILFIGIEILDTYSSKFRNWSDKSIVTAVVNIHQINKNFTTSADRHVYIFEICDARILSRSTKRISKFFS